MTYWVPEASGKLIKANHLQHANVGTSTASPMNKHKWEFSPRFRRDIFGWKSDLPIKRIKEALTEIRKIARKEPALAAEGAVLFLEKLWLLIFNYKKNNKHYIPLKIKDYLIFDKKLIIDKDNSVHFKIFIITNLYR